MRRHLDLILDNGDIVRMECSNRHEDEIYETIEATMRQRTWLPFTRWESCTATFQGHSLERLNMGRVVGML